MTDRAYYKSIVRRQISDLVQSHESVQFGADQHDSIRQSLHDITRSKWVKLTLNVGD